MAALQAVFVALAGIASGSELRGTAALRPLSVLEADLVPSCGAQRPATQLCDPEHLLSDAQQLVHSRALQQLRRNGTHCNQTGISAYFLLLDVPSSAGEAAAARLGRRWGVLGGPCRNGAVALFSTRDRKLSLAADAPVLAKLKAAELPERAELAARGLFGVSLSEAGMAAMAEFEEALEGRYVLQRSNAEILLKTLSYCCAAFLIALFIGCLYDTALSWRHRARFLSCQKKMQRVHTAFVNRKGTMPLCPHCLGSVGDHHSPSVVVYLCGHRFHMDCANHWARDMDCKAGCCPICEGFPGEQLKEPEDPMACRDEAKCFILRSLQAQYPEIISTDCMRRWADCHTELWMSELICPRYVSLFKKKAIEQ